jgi:hypothetical protein
MLTIGQLQSGSANCVPIRLHIIQLRNTETEHELFEQEPQATMP